jgi:hypothetical protein
MRLRTLKKTLSVEKSMVLHQIKATVFSGLQVSVSNLSYKMTSLKTNHFDRYVNNMMSFSSREIAPKRNLNHY